jgi:flagellin-like hook-associated protein FlgL
MGIEVYDNTETQISASITSEPMGSSIPSGLTILYSSKDYLSDTVYTQNNHVGNVLYSQGVIIITDEEYQNAIIPIEGTTTTTTSTTSTTTTIVPTTTTTSTTTSTTTTIAPTTTTTSTTTAAPTTTTSTTTSTTTAASTTTTSTTTSTTTESPTTTTTTSTTTTTTTAIVYDHYIADKYQCSTCTLVTSGLVVAFPAGQTVTINKFYPDAGDVNHVYEIVGTFGTGPGLILDTSFGQFDTCALACV